VAVKWLWLFAIFHLRAFDFYQVVFFFEQYLGIQCGLDRTTAAPAMLRMFAVAGVVDYPSVGVKSKRDFLDSFEHEARILRAVFVACHVIVKRINGYGFNHAVFWQYFIDRVNDLRGCVGCIEVYTTVTDQEVIDMANTSVFSP